MIFFGYEYNGDGFFIYEMGIVFVGSWVNFYNGFLVMVGGFTYVFSYSVGFGSTMGFC